MKKTLALLLALLMLLSGVTVASASQADANYTITTAFYAENGEGDWEEVSSVPAESNVKMRVSIETNFVSGPATLLFAYDKSVVSADGLSTTGSSEMALNENFDFTDKIQQISGANGQNAANKQFGLGNITSEQFEAYGFIVASIRTNGCVIYDSSDWLFEIDMTVLNSGKGKSLECFIIPETVCTVENNQGFVAFPYAEDENAGLGELASAYLWYENAPVLNSKEVTVTPSLNERSITFIVDGNEEKVEYYNIGDEIASSFIPEKEGYVFAGWNPSLPETMSDENIITNATWEPATDTKYTVETYMQTLSGNYALEASYTYTGTTDETVNAEYEIPEGFNLNAEKSSLSGIIASDGSLKLDVYFDRNTYSFTTVVDGVGNSSDYLYGAEIATPETPEKEGYKFAGWEPSIPSTMPANDVTVSATWIAADDVAYTVETYTMGADGKYTVSKVAYSGTTGETVKAEYSVPEGFRVNGENSVFSGVIAADGSLVLKVYIDRSTYKFTTVVDGVETSSYYLYGATVDSPATPSKKGYEFTGWSAQIPQTMPASDFTAIALFKCTATVRIKNNPGSKTINYGETLRLTAETANVPEGAKIFWYVDGAKKGEGTTFEVSPSSGTVEVTVKLVDANGNDYDDGISDSQKVSVNSGFFQKIISFFKNLFGMNRTIIQKIFR